LKKGSTKEIYPVKRVILLEMLSLDKLKINGNKRKTKEKESN
jgi:hypothetical protein